ncbi:MAG: cell division protein [Sphingomonadaceae bacterium]
MRAPTVFKQRPFRGAASFGARRGAHLLPNARLGGPMPWVIAIMVALTTLAAGAALALTHVANSARSELAGGATVQIVNADDAARDSQAEQVVHALSSMPGITQVERVPQRKIASLIEPWLGSQTGSDGVPLPALIDVRLSGGADGARLTRIRQALHRIAPDARIDPQAEWLKPVFRALDALRWLALSLIALLAFTSAAAVWLAARHALDTNRETIEIVHHLGGNDTQIAQIFQRSVLSDALLGSFLGVALGASAIGILSARFAALDSGLAGTGALGLSDWLVISLVPAGAVLLALSTARLTVLAKLGKML